MAEVERRWIHKENAWKYVAVMSFIKPCPKRNEFDEWKPGMEDEATSDTVPAPYCIDPAEDTRNDGDNFVAFDDDDWDPFLARSKQAPRLR